MTTFGATIRALVAPRRGIAIALVVGALVAIQVYYGGARTAVVPLGMSIAFLLVGPWSWRVLLSQRVTAINTIAYAAIAACVVMAFGVGLPHLLRLGPTFLTDLGSLAIAGVLCLVGGWGLGRDIDLELDLDRARLAAIKAHFDPHFLYNTLNAIAEWCVEDPKVAEAATIRLADLLRATLEGLEQRTWPIEKELALVEDLFALYRVRDPAFDARIERDGGTFEIAPLVIVSIVENAIKHGRGGIVVRIARSKCEVENAGAYAPKAPGRGIATLRSRLAVAYGRDATFSIGARGDRTLAVLEVPA